MELSNLQGTNLYIPSGVAVASAVWGYIPRFNPGVPTVDLADTWSNASGFYVFFPAADRGSGWAPFVDKLKSAMRDGTNRRFGFFDLAGAGLGFLSVSGTGGEQALTEGTSFRLRNIALVVSPIQNLVAATLDGDTFRIQNLTLGSAHSVMLDASPGGIGVPRSIQPVGDLRIPGAGSTPGTLAIDLALTPEDQAALETGPMYFSQPAGAALTGLRYPTFVGSAGGGSPIAAAAHIDPALQVDARRTYFRLLDPVLGTTFSTTDGRQITLLPDEGPPESAELSPRFVLCDRPVKSPGDEAAYYLNPIGAFNVGVTRSDAAGEILCAYSSTEALSFTLGDLLRLVPGCPAFHDAATPRAFGGSAAYLTSAATTSWLSFRSLDVQNTYFSQPQGSPIYQSNGVTGRGDHTAHQLSFRPIPVWPPAGAEALSGLPEETVPVPMVPYGGVSTSSPAVAERYEALETTAINPERRRVFTAPESLRAFKLSTPAAAAAQAVEDTMTPLGLVAGFDAGGALNVIKLGVSGASNQRVLQMRDIQAPLRTALQQNQIFLVIDRDTDGAQKLFTFGAEDATVELAGWFFDLQLQGQSPDGVPPMLLLKLFRDRSIKELVDDPSLWAEASTFSSDPAARKEQIQRIISEAEEAVSVNPASPYAGFVRAVNDPSFSGLLALNSTLRLEELPSAIKALLGGMTNEDGTSNLAAFRAHHVGVEINDTSDGDSVVLNASSMFALVDYHDSSAAAAPAAVPAPAPAGRAALGLYPCGPNGRDCYDFQVLSLLALFENRALTSFSADIDLTVKSLFAVAVKLLGVESNVIRIKGSYSEHGGAQTYSFVAVTPYHFEFSENPYLKKIAFDKVQFSSAEATGAAAQLAGTSTITSRFAIWGSMEFGKLEFLDMFAFDKLSFADLGIEMSYVLHVPGGGAEPSTSDLGLWFAPGDLRFDFTDTVQREGDDSMLARLPFKLRSFLYSEKGQDISELSYFGISLGAFGVETDPRFNFALLFDFDLGSLGFLVSSQSAFKLSVLLGWQPPTGAKPNALVFGVQMPEADGQLELDIEGVLKIVVEQFVLEWSGEGDDGLLALVLHNSYMEVLGVRMPPGKVVFDFALFAPRTGDDKIGWIAAFNSGAETGNEALRGAPADGPIGAMDKLRRAGAIARAAGGGGDDDEGSLFKLDFLGAGQRVGPSTPPDTFEGFLEYMKTDFWGAVASGDYASVYQPAGGWLVLASFELLKAIGVGFLFYDTSALYSLTISVTKPPLEGLSFQVTYTKISDDVGLFFIDLTLPDALRTFQAGAASITLPSLKLSVYTNGDFKVDLGFPADNDWSGSFRVEAFAGPIPVTGSGGFYIAKLSSATDKTFKGNYSTILAAGLGARLGVGKNFTAGPLKAGVSLTFYGIIEGAMGYRAYDAATDGNVVKWLTTPRALSLKGQFGIIGELYGTVDFKIIKASVNVKIQAGIGIQLLLEDGLGGEILLWIDTRVEVSVSVKINLGLFSIKIGFSFKMGFRFEWKLLDSSSAKESPRLAARAQAPGYDPDFPLQAGLSRDLQSWMTPELTSVWSDVQAAGTPWFAVSLTMEYVEDFASVSSPAGFKSFETLAAQMVSWALNATLGIGSWADRVLRIDLEALNEDPERLVGSLTYDTLVAGLAKMFVLAVESVPPDDGKTAAADKETKVATVMAVPPFLTLKTSGRGTELEYAFQSKSNVSEEWVRTELQAYFEQLYTNITSGGDRARARASAEAATVPLIQAFFLDWFHAVVRSTLNAVVTQMQNDDVAEAQVDKVYLAAVKSGQVRNVAGQMAQFFRSGLRLPQTAGMELPDGLPLQPTNPLYGLVWQEFPVGEIKDGDGYEVRLLPDPAQPWVRTDAKWDLKKSAVDPYRIAGTSIPVPGSPGALPALQRGPQSFALTNAIQWTPAPGQATTLRPFANAMTLALAAGAPLALRLQRRTTGKAYDTQTEPVPTADVRWALAVQMDVRKVPVTTGVFLPVTFALGAASVTVQDQMRALLAALGATPGRVKAIRLLYQTASGEPGLVSSPAPKQLFVLRTNTTTQAVPPPTALTLASTTDHAIAVGADTSDPFGFLQILEQASVTNQTGYFLTFVDEAGGSLPPALFGDQTVAPVTILFELDIPAASEVYSIDRYVNAAVLDNTLADRLYYAETTAAAEETPYVAVAAGAAGVELSRAEPGDSTVIDDLARLYSFVAFQVPASPGIIASNLSVPAGPQKDSEASTVERYRLFVPLYKLAADNQGKIEQNRYASVGKQFSVQTLVVDAFGNAFGQPVTAVSGQTDLYFDDLVPLSNWSGVRSTFDFNARSSPSDDTACASIAQAKAAAGAPERGKLSVYLCPSAATLPAPLTESALATAELYTTVVDQLTGPAAGLFVATNLDPAGSDIALSGAQTAAVVDMLRTIKRYLLGEQVTLRGVALTVSVPGSSVDLPLVFQIQVSFGVKRTSFLSPEVAGYPDASRVTTDVAALGAANDLTGFAASFSVAFPDFSMAVGPADARDVSVGGQQAQKRAEGDARPADPKGLWAVSRKVTDLSLSSEVRYYLAPKPLATRLRSGAVPMPNDLPPLRGLPATRTVSDVDLDNLARETFAAIDSALQAENASASFRISPDSYRGTAYAREDIADRYADNEVTWLLDAAAFKGDGSDLCQGRDQMAQQMRSALGSAYSVDTIVQTRATFRQALPASMGNRLQLFGQMQRVGGETPVTDSGGFGLGTTRVDVPAGSGGQSVTTTFLFGIPRDKLEDARYQTLNLEWAVTHLQVFLEDREIDYCKRGEVAPPSIWLQLVNAFPEPPKMGETIIPLPFREYPTPPTAIAQTARRDTEAKGESLADQTRWVYTTTYQARLFAADEIMLDLVYNTGAPEAAPRTAAAGAVPQYTLFEALVRFQAGYAILQPQMTPVTEATPPDVLAAFAVLVSELANNSDWMPGGQFAATAVGPVLVVERDVVTDRPKEGTEGEREIVLRKDPRAALPNPWIGDKCVTALDPSTMKPYPGEVQSCSGSGSEIVTHTYTPVPPLSASFVTHRVEVKGLTTLLYENANTGIGTRRNASLYPDPAVVSNSVFVYKTPTVALTNPVTPFVDNPTPIQIYPAVVPERDLDLGDYIRRTLGALLGVDEPAEGGARSRDIARAPHGVTAAQLASQRRLKIDARFGYPIGSPSGTSTSADRFVPLLPAVLVRSFDLPVEGLAAALDAWVGTSGDTGESPEPYAAVLAQWLQSEGLSLGAGSSPAGAMLVLDVTVYSRLSTGGNQVPLLRLSQLRLQLSAVAPPPVKGTGEAA